MNIQYIKNTETLIAGLTLKDPDNFEEGNLALHTTKNKENVIKTRSQLMDTIGTTMTQFTAAEQTHSTNLHQVVKADQGRGATTMANAIPNTDALYTTEADILLCLFTADCVPVIFHDHENKLVGVIHSGWQGTVKEITPKVFHHLIEKEQIQPKNISVHLGPALSQKMFEVDTDVFERYANLEYAEDFIRYNDATGKYHIDNQKVVQKQCERSGIPKSQITCDRTCTYLSDAHFSYRQDRNTGRHLSFIMMK